MLVWIKSATSLASPMKFSMNCFWLGVVRADDLDGHALDEFARAVLLGFIDDAHAALKNLADDLVAKLALDGEERHAADGGKMRPAKSSPATAIKNRNFFMFFACTPRLKIL